mmetsp:Transcript_49118/g.122004  ORF Transcript_49118/g.122004 Transcript_49118/m.122004 type:complete len:323 (+) Transcript_49118:60-1028(+)
MSAGRSTPRVIVPNVWRRIGVTNRLVGDDFVRVEDAVRVEEALGLSHQLDHRGALGEVQHVALGRADPVLRRDGAARGAHPFVHEGLERLAHLAAQLPLAGGDGVEVEVAVAHVAKAAHARAKRRHPAARRLDQLVQPWERQRHIVLVHMPFPQQCGGHVLPHAPQRGGLRGALRDDRVAHVRLLGGALQEREEPRLERRGVGAAQLDEHVHGVRRGQRRARAARGEGMGGGVEELARRENVRKRGGGGGVCAQHSGEGRQAEEGELRRGGRGGAGDRTLRDHAERALRADEELLQVVARVVLAQGPHGVEDRPVGQHSHQP